MRGQAKIQKSHESRERPYMIIVIVTINGFHRQAQQASSGGAAGTLRGSYTWGTNQLGLRAAR